MNNLEYLFGFGKAKVDKVIRFYALVNKMKEKIETYGELLKVPDEKHDKAYMDKIQSSIVTCQNLTNDISALGEEIIK